MDYKTSTAFDNLDRPYKVTDRTNLVTETSYFADGLVESTTQASGTAESRTTNYEYDGLARTRVVKRQRDNSPQGGPVYDVTTTKYDAVGNLVSLTDPAGNVTEFSYDRAYRKTGDATLARLQPTGSPQLVSRSYQYDKQNNLRLVTDRNGRQTQYDYDGLDRRTTERWLGATGNGYKATFAYDLAGNLKSADDQYGTTPYSSVGYDLDGLYRTTKLTTKLPGVAPTTAASRFDSEVGSTYDVAGNRTSSTVAVNGVTELTTSYGFDNLDRTTSIHQSGPTIFARGVNFDYHADGRVKGTTRLSGNTAGGIFGITIANSFLTGTSVSKFHATTGRLESLTHADNTGNPEVQYTFAYDTLSRIKAIPETRPQVSGATTRPYDYDLTDQTTQADNQETFFAANGTRTGGGYLTDRDNRLALDPSSAYTYDAEGNRVSRTALAVPNNGVFAIDNTPDTTVGSWTPSATGYAGGQSVGVWAAFGGNAVATWQVADLPAGKFEVYATWAALGAAGATDGRFSVAAVDTVLNSESESLSAPVNFQTAPTADLRHANTDWAKIGFVKSSGDKVVTVTLSTATIGSVFGRVAADAILIKATELDIARTTYEWDHQNRLTKVSNESAKFPQQGAIEYSPYDSSSFAYDVLGRRAAVTYDKADPNDTHGEFHRVSIHDGSQVVWTARSGGRDEPVNNTQAMLWAPGTDQLLAIQQRLAGGAPLLPVWTLTDHQGTVKDYLVVRAANTASELFLTRQYSAFGTPLRPTYYNADPSLPKLITDIGGSSGFFYVGQEYDATTGLQYSRARYYDPVSSEFISQDPLGFAGGDTNLYRRAGNSPANATDPSGLAVFLAVPPLLAAAKIALAYAGVQASFALGESAIEVGATWWAGGEVSGGSAAETFGKNFAINVATGGIGTKAKLASRVGLYALRQGIEIGGDTAFDVGWRGQDFRSSLAINAAGSLIGEAAGRVAIAGARRALSRGSIDDVLRAGKNAGAPTQFAPAAIHPGRIAAESADASRASVMRALRAADTPEAHAVAKLLKRGKVDIEFLPTDPLGQGAWGRAPWGSKTVQVYLDKAGDSLNAAGIVAHETRHVLDSWCNVSSVNHRYGPARVERSETRAGPYRPPV